jgi:hypothetical protein
VSGTPRDWATALKTRLRKLSATPNEPFTTYSLPDQLPAGLPPSGTRWLFSDTKVYDAAVDARRSSTGLARGPSVPAPHAPAPYGRPPFASPLAWPTNTGALDAGACQQPAITTGSVYTPSQVQKAYGTTGLTAAAGSVAPRIDVIDLGGGWNPSDLRMAGACFGYGAVHVSQSQGDGVPTPPPSSASTSRPPLTCRRRLR